MCNIGYVRNVVLLNPGFGGDWLIHPRAKATGPGTADPSFQTSSVFQHGRAPRSSFGSLTYYVLKKLRVQDDTGGAGRHDKRFHEPKSGKSLREVTPPFAPTPFDDLVILGFCASFELACPALLDSLSPSNGAVSMQIQRPDCG
ncbi:hypothetical protein AB1N83_002631 [Pleurotus pulmonarius]